MPQIKSKMYFDNGNWILDKYCFSPNADYTLARAAWRGCELNGPKLERAKKIFEREIVKWFGEE